MKRTSWIKQTILFLIVAMVSGFSIPQADAAGFFRRLFRPNVVYRQYAPTQQKQVADENNVTQENVTANTVTELPKVDEDELQTGAGNFVESESDGLTQTEITAPVEIATEENPSEETAVAEDVAETTEEVTPEVEGLTLTETERHVYEYTNAERKRRGLAPLKLNRRLVESARRQASWMAQTGVFRHGNSGFAENIAMGQPSPQAVVRAWMNSSGHMRNMMNRYHGCIGIGAVRGRNGQLYWCQQFSR